MKLLGAKVSAVRAFTLPEDGATGTTLVGRYRPNAYGLYDVVGNVSEFCSGYYSKATVKGAGNLEDFERRLYGGLNSQLDYHGYRTARGGSFVSTPEGARVSGREPVGEDQSMVEAGVRAAMTLP